MWSMIVKTIMPRIYEVILSNEERAKVLKKSIDDHMPESIIIQCCIESGFKAYFPVSKRGD